MEDVMQHQRTELKACIEICLACYTTCQQTALMHCLDLGNSHVDPHHYRLMADCANACRTAAERMDGHGAHHEDTWRICADLCRQCAADCAGLGGMDDCVTACRRCAESCEAMADGALAVA